MSIKFSFRRHFLYPFFLSLIYVLFISPTFVRITDDNLDDKNAIPSIPFSSLFSESPSSETVDTFIRALSTVGFVKITGAHVSAEGLKKEALSFFKRSHKEKMGYNFGPYGNDRGGFTPQGIETVSATASDDDVSNTGKDRVESYVFRDNRNLEQHPDRLSTLAMEYFSQMESILKRLNLLTSLGLGLNDPTFFDDFFWSDENDANGNALRLSYYPARGEEKECESKICSASLRYGPHTDYQHFTILLLDDNDHRQGFGGLEVLVEDLWVPVVPPGDGSQTLVVNSGDLLPLWTNGLFKSNLHRVSNPTSPEGAVYERLTLPFFSGPIHGRIIDPIVREGEEKLYESISSEDHLRAKLGLSNE